MIVYNNIIMIMILYKGNCGTMLLTTSQASFTNLKTAHIHIMIISLHLLKGVARRPMYSMVL